MTAERMIDIMCDGCDERYDLPSPTAWQVRADAHRQGWRYRGGRDLCPYCSGYAARMGWGPRDEGGDY